jgi:hypothetical protein
VRIAPPPKSIEEVPVATVMLLRWQDVTEEQYEQARDKVGWEADVPKGAKLHVAGFSNDGLTVVDVWESEEAFQAFAEERLMPAVKEIGIESDPNVAFYPMHACFAPGFDRQETLRDL